MEALKTSVVAGHWERMDEEEGVDGSETPIVSWQVIVVYSFSCVLLFCDPMDSM